MIQSELRLQRSTTTLMDLILWSDLAMDSVMPFIASSSLAASAFGLKMTLVVMGIPGLMYFIAELLASYY